MALEDMVMFGIPRPVKERTDLVSTKPPCPQTPTGSSQKELKSTHVFKELNAVPKPDLLNLLEN